MKISQLYPIAREKLDQRAAMDPQLRAVMKRVKEGKATFADTALYNERLSNMLGETLADFLPELVDPGAKESVCEQLLRDEYENMNQLLAAVQKEMDGKMGLGLQPVRAPFPSERVRQIAHALEDMTVAAEVIGRRAAKAVPTVSKSFHDDYIRTNARVRNDLGLKPILQRYGTGCCSWCASVAGKWRFGEQPDDVFRRHDNCDCVIIYDTQVLRGVRTEDGGRSKTWEEVDPSDVIANPPKKMTPEEAEELQNSILQQLTLGRERDILRLEAGSPFKNPKTPLTIDSLKQSKHIRGGKRYNDYMQSHEIEPSYLTISEEKAQELVDKFHGTGILKMNLKGELLPNEIIIDNDEVVGVVVNNLTGAFQETTAFKIQYGPDGTHIVPTYESQKRHYLERRSQNGHDWLLRQKM